MATPHQALDAAVQQFAHSMFFFLCDGRFAMATVRQTQPEFLGPPPRARPLLTAFLPSSRCSRWPSATSREPMPQAAPSISTKTHPSTSVTG